MRDGVERPAPRAEPEEDDEETREAEELVYPPPRRLRVGAEVRGQTHVALTVLRDPEGGECLVRVLGCFASAADADAWSRNVGTRAVTESDTHVASTCEWLYPNAEPRGREHYRVDELQRIMDAAARNPVAVRR